ncbi:MAG: ABC transporter permease subunit [Silicimonas sp.]|nr:ABC transporter permease subunit [Silicimonas sp.]
MCAPLAFIFWTAGRGGGIFDLRGTSFSFAGLLRNLERVNQLAETTGALPLSGMFWSSLGLALGVAAVTTTVSFLAAFAMLRVPGRISGLCFWITLATLLFPIEARMLPTFEVTVALGLVGGWTGMILPVLPLALGTLVFRQHFKIMPPELAEAARLDGAGTLRYLRDFLIPLSAGPIGAVFLISFVYGWNQYLWPLIVSVDDAVYPLMRGMNLAGTGSGAGFAIAAVSMLPPLILVLGFLRLMTRMTAIRG